MRRAALLLIASTFMAMPTMAQSATEQANFGRANCPPPFPCPSASDTEMNRSLLPLLIGRANSCVGTYFGISSSTGIFQSRDTLDYNNCLTGVKSTSPKGAMDLIPKCCIVPVDSSRSSCIMACDLIATR